MIIDWWQHKYEGHIKFLGLTKFGWSSVLKKYSRPTVYIILHCTCSLFLQIISIAIYQTKFFHSSKTSMNGKLHALSKHIVLGSSLI